ncbi:MAG: class II glutamine amidotransferase [Roseiflexaceae bacterium]
MVADRSVSIDGPLLYAHHSLKQQCRQDSQGRHNRDGWGIGYYHNNRARVEKRPVPACADPHFEATARAAQSHMFVAHVRRATAQGVIKDTQHTHPFLVGGWMLAQNGGIGGVWHRQIRQTLGKGVIKGRTSGEHLLHWLHRRAAHLPEADQDQAIIGALGELCAQAQGIRSANFVMATGQRLYGFRFAPDTPDGYTFYYRHEQIGPACAVQVASEPLTADATQWQALPNGHLLVVDCGLAITTHRVGAG